MKVHPACKSEPPILHTIIPQVELFSFVFWENLGDHKLLSRFTDLYVYLYITYRPSYIQGSTTTRETKSKLVKFWPEMLKNTK